MVCLCFFDTLVSASCNACARLQLMTMHPRVSHEPWTQLLLINGRIEALMHIGLRRHGRSPDVALVASSARLSANSNTPLL